MPEAGYGSIADRWNPYNYGSIERRDYYDLGITAGNLTKASLEGQGRAAVLGDRLFNGVSENDLIRHDTLGAIPAPAVPVASGPRAAAAAAATAAGPVATSQPRPNFDFFAGRRNDDRGLNDAQAETDPFSFALRKPQLQLPANADSPEFGETQRLRANSAGSSAAALYARFKEEKAGDILKPPVIGGQALEYDLEGKAISGDVLHRKLYDDTRFQSLLHANPKQAANLYRAITDRDLATDIHMQGGQTASRIKSNQGMIDEFDKNEGTFDPDTGVPVMNKLVEDKLRPGEYKTVQVPVGYRMAKVLDEHGFYKARTGFDKPALAAIPKDVPPEAESAYRQLRSQKRMANPQATARQLDLDTRKELFGIKEKTGPSWWEKPEQAAGVVGHAYNRVATGIANKAFVDPVNQALAYHNMGQIPRVKPFSGDFSLTDKLGDLAFGAKDAYNDFSLKDYLERKLEEKGMQRVR